MEAPSVRERRQRFESLALLPTPPGYARPRAASELCAKPVPAPRRSQGLVVVRPRLPDPDSAPAPASHPPSGHHYAVYGTRHGAGQDEPSVRPSTSYASPSPAPSLASPSRPLAKPSALPLSRPRSGSWSSGLAGLWRRESPSSEVKSVANSSFYVDAESEGGSHYASAALTQRQSFFHGLKPRSASDPQPSSATERRPSLAQAASLPRPSASALQRKDPSSPGASLLGPVRRRRMSGGSEGEDEAETSSTDSSSELANRRAARARRIKRQTTMAYEAQAVEFRRRGGRGGRLFELAACVRLCPVGRLSEEEATQLRLQGLLRPDSEGRYVPVLEWSSPASSSAANEDTLAMLPFLAFPDFTHLPSQPASSVPEPFVVTMTNEAAERRFAFCLRHSFPHQLPEVLVVLSPIQAGPLYFSLLRHGVLVPAALQRDFFAAAWRSALPADGQRLRLELPGTRLGQSVVLEGTRAGRPTADGCAKALARIGVDNAVAVFTALLCEKRVLVAGESVGSVAGTVGALAGLLHPLQWPHTFFPIVPDSHVHLCHCPTPYLIGILRVNLNQLKELLTGADEDEEEFLFILDLDYGIVRDSDYSEARDQRLRAKSIVPGRPVPESRCLPASVLARLRGALKEALSCPSPDKDWGKADRAVEAGFEEALDVLLGHWPQHLARQQDGALVVDRAAFAQAPASRAHRAFLRWFTQSALFQLWLRARLADCPRDQAVPDLGHSPSKADVLGGLLRNVSSLFRL